MRAARQLFSPVLALLVTSAVISSLVVSPATALSRSRAITAATPVTTFASGLDEPLGITTDASGDVYVASLCQVGCGNGALITEYAPDGVVLATYTVSGAYDPVSIALSGNYLYVDTFSWGVWRVALAGDPAPGTATAIALPVEFSLGPCGNTDVTTSMTADASGNLFFGDECGDVYEMANLGGSPAAFSSPALVSGLVVGTGIFGIASDAPGHLALSQYFVNSISLMSDLVAPTGPWVSDVVNPRGIAYDASGNLYAASGSFDCVTSGVLHASCGLPTSGTITRVDPSGTAVVLASGLSPAWDVAVDPTGNLFATETYTGNVIELAATSSGPSVSASEVSSFPAGTSISATWTGTPGATSFTCTLLYGFDAPSTFKVTTTSHSCTFGGLDPHALYGVRVVANYPDGSTSVATSTFASSVRVLNARIVCARGHNRRVVVGVSPRCPLGWHRI